MTPTNEQRVETRERQNRRLCTSVVSGILAAGLAPMAVGCAVFAFPPDQSQFATLSSLARSSQAVVRLYGAPIPGIEIIAIHPWFVVKRAGATRFDRWEVWQTAGGLYGHVRKNRTSNLFGGVWSGGSYIIEELI